MELEVGNLVLCTVDRIVGTVVFVKIEGNKEGSIITSEIAPGRIRNLREYVVPKKKIVCKIIRISPNGNVDLSLRRVSLKEKKEVLERDKQEKNYLGVLKSILGQKAEDVLKEISKENGLFDFLQEAKENSAKLKKLAGEPEAKKILKIITTQKQKKAVIKKEITLKTDKPEGIKLIKDILGSIDADVRYLCSGLYSIKKSGGNIKELDRQIKEIISTIEKQAKKEGLEFQAKEK